MLTRTTALSQLYRSDKTLIGVSLNGAQFHLAKYCNAQILASRCLMDPRVAHFLFLTHTKNFLAVTYCDTIVESGVSLRTHGRKDGRLDRQTGKFK